MESIVRSETVIDDVKEIFNYRDRGSGIGRYCGHRPIWRVALRGRTARRDRRDVELGRLGASDQAE